MHRPAVRERNAPGAVLPGIFGAVIFAAACIVTGGARAEPPITSVQDAACRAEARARVFLVPDPRNVGLHEIGRRLYESCMRRFDRPAGRKRHRHHRRRR